ncbi:MAG: hypothetical protein OFPI_02350 [Osedax symbiont Rs2]|nr:MAG: hypothetical protein OFPI_02350 [Osedax symbiont Rs2]
MRAYLVLDFSIADFAKFKVYIEQIPAFIEKHSGRYIVRGVVPDVVEGDWQPQRFVIIEFPSKAQANEFLQDPDAQPLFAIRHSTTDSKLILVEGCLP